MGISTKININSARPIPETVSSGIITELLSHSLQKNEKATNTKDCKFKNFPTGIKLTTKEENSINFEEIKISGTIDVKETSDLIYNTLSVSLDKNNYYPQQPVKNDISPKDVINLLGGLSEEQFLSEGEQSTAHFILDVRKHLSRVEGYLSESAQVRFGIKRVNEIRKDPNTQVIEVLEDQTPTHNTPSSTIEDITLPTERWPTDKLDREKSYAFFERIWMPIIEDNPSFSYQSFKEADFKLSGTLATLFSRNGTPKILLNW